MRWQLKNILIIADYFAPERSVASIRLTKIAKYLSRNDDCKVTVITSRRENFNKDRLLERDLNEILIRSKIIEVNNTSRLRSAFRFINKKHTTKNNVTSSSSNLQTKERKETAISKSLKNLKSLLSSLVIIYEGHLFSIRAIKKLDNWDEYSTVISTFGFFGPHLLARKIKKKNDSVKWIADFRDPVIDFGDSIQWWCDRYCLSVTSNANEVIAVSRGIKDVLITNDKSRVRIIDNGFDDEELNFVSDSIISNDGKFHMVYTGSIYPRLDMPPLFLAIKELIEEGKICSDLIQIDYAGRSYEGFIKYAKGTNLKDVIINHGYVDRDISLALQRDSHIMILGTWNFKVSPNVMTGKIYEYFMMQKPIIVFVNGDTKNGHLKSLINNNKLGYCYESYNEKVDFIELKDFIYSEYNKFCNNEISKLPENKLVSKYSYRNIANEFYKLIT